MLHGFYMWFYKFCDQPAAWLYVTSSGVTADLELECINYDSLNRSAFGTHHLSWFSQLTEKKSVFVIQYTVSQWFSKTKSVLLS